LQEVSFRRLPAGPAYGPPDNAIAEYDLMHGSVVTGIIGSLSVGIAKNAELVFTEVIINDLLEKTLEAFVKVAEDAAKNPNNTCVVNMSWGMLEKAPISYSFYAIMATIMRGMEERYGCVFVAAPGNDGGPPSSYPALLKPFLNSMFIVGAVSIDGKRYTGNTGSITINAYAPGVDIVAFGLSHTGTSFAAPQVAGLVAYFRGHPSWSQGEDHRSIYAGIKGLERHIKYVNYPDSEVPIIWNGQTRPQCAPLKRGLEGRQLGEDDSCPFPGGGSGPGGPQGPRVEFKSGEPGPLCNANCGTLCSGFYCVPNPTGMPPDFSSPSIPNPTDGTPTITKPPSLPTDFIDCQHHNQNPGQGIDSAYCVCSGSTFSDSTATWVTPHNSCAYTAKPSGADARCPRPLPGLLRRVEHYRRRPH
jgi:hypothetical protein